MSEQIPYGQLERDLCRLVEKRVSDAILSVLQLKEDTGQAYLISLSAASIAAGMWGACFAAHHNLNEPIDLPSALEALAVAMREKTK